MFCFLNQARSPVFSHLSATLQGLHTIRAYRAQEQFRDIFDWHLDLHSRAWFLFLCTNRWLGIIADLISWMFVVGVAFTCILAADSKYLYLFTFTLFYFMFHFMYEEGTEAEM